MRLCVLIFCASKFQLTLILLLLYATLYKNLLFFENKTLKYKICNISTDCYF